MRNLFSLLIGLLVICQPVHAEHSDVVVVSSIDGYGPTLERLEAAIKKRGIKVFARIDHAAGAKEIGAEVDPSIVMLIGNPAIGTPIMQQKPQAALELPLRIAVVQHGGRVTVIYHEPQTIAKIWHITPVPPQLEKAAGVINTIANEAAGRDIAGAPYSSR